mmetsp:Transcript_36430/g.42532  ORF Transcript_36430/g.42532 Transcript_36430/m.42532 type:complete len:281 (+) Transcript_36430:32-874(+)
MESESKNWVVSTDGSRASKDAFWQLFKEFYSSEDKLEVVSITDPAKTYLPYEYLPTTIYNDYKTELLSKIHPSKYKIVMKEKSEGSTVREEILKYVEGAFALFIGYHGRKGEKEDPTVMGQTVRFSAYKSSVPLFVIKSLALREKTKSKGFTYLVCMDGSDKALRGLEFAAKLLKKPEDKIVAVSVWAIEFADKIPSIEKSVERFAEEKNIKIEYILLPKTVDIKVTIVEFINKSEKCEVDFVVFGNHGLRQQFEGKGEFLGSFAANIIANANANPIMIP